VELSIPGAHLHIEADYVVGGNKTRQSENLGHKYPKTSRLTDEFKVSYCLKSKRGDQQNLTDLNGLEGGCNKILPEGSGGTRRRLGGW
jgi:hypothetical protein